MKKIISIMLIFVLLMSIVPFSLAAYGQRVNNDEDDVSECSDGIDNDEDGYCDYLDPRIMAPTRFCSDGSIYGDSQCKNVGDDSEKKESSDDNEDEIDDDDDEVEDDEDEVDDENETEDDDEREGIQIGGKSRAMMRLDKVSEVALENIKKARENYLKARERYEEAKNKAKENREKIKELKDELKKCKEDESDECNKVRDEAKTETKGFLGKSVEAIINALEKVKARIQESDRFTEEEKTDMISRIDEKIKEIQEAMDSIKDATTGQEIKEAAKKINAVWKDTKYALNKYSHKSAIAKFGNIVNKFEKVSDRLENAINKLAEQGKDITELTALKKNYDDKVKDAINKLEEASKESVSEEEYSIVKAKFKEAKDSLKEAHSILKDLIKKIKEKDSTAGVEVSENE